MSFVYIYMHIMLLSLWQWVFQIEWPINQQKFQKPKFISLGTYSQSAVYNWKAWITFNEVIKKINNSLICVASFCTFRSLFWCGRESNTITHQVRSCTVAAFSPLWLALTSQPCPFRFCIYTGGFDIYIKCLYNKMKPIDNYVKLINMQFVFGQGVDLTLYNIIMKWNEWKRYYIIF